LYRIVPTAESIGYCGDRKATSEVEHFLAARPGGLMDIRDLARSSTMPGADAFRQRKDPIEKWGTSPLEEVPEIAQPEGDGACPRMPAKPRVLEGVDPARDYSSVAASTWFRSN
jgi:hypothetical protein